MRHIEAYEAVDGTVFTRLSKCQEHDLNCIGELFDALLLEAAQATGGNVTRNTQYSMCLRLIEKRKELAPTIRKLNAYIAAEQVEL
jgi:hypothetical protein